MPAGAGLSRAFPWSSSSRWLVRPAATPAISSSRSVRRLARAVMKWGKTSGRDLLRQVLRRRPSIDGFEARLRYAATTRRWRRSRRHGVPAIGSLTAGCRCASSSSRRACRQRRYSSPISARRVTKKHCAPIDATEQCRAGSRRLSGPVHRRVSQTVGVRVFGAADVFKRHAADLVRQQPRFRMKRLQSCVLHLENPAHLLHEQE